MKDKKIIILSIVGVLMLVSIVVATSYAYFVANVSGNKDTNNVVVTNGVMALEYKDGDEITLANAVPGSSVSKTFTVKNTGNVSTNYTIYFSELSNKFVDKTDLVYTLTSSDGGKSVAQTQVPDSNEAMVSNYSIAAGKTHTYTLTITFLDKDENQDDNQCVSFSTKVSINETKEASSQVASSAASTIKALAATDTVNFATDDPDNNIRYIGANPNNYVYFNCSDYNNQSDSTCEKWRIIGVFKNMTKSDGSKEDLVKIIRDDSIGNYSWDSSDSSTNYGWGVNDWTNADVMKLLNSGYDSETVGGSLYWNAKSGTCYNGAYNATTSCDFTSTGLKNDLTRNAIESVVWNLSGSSTFNDVTASMFYSRERGTTVYSGPTTWTGKVGLMYPSDYGYATSGGSTTNRAACLAKELFNWDGSNVSDCYNNDYLLKSYSQWTLTPNSSDSYGVFYVDMKGFVSYGRYAYGTDGVWPVAFLKSNILISEVGNGSSESPLQLSMK